MEDTQSIFDEAFEKSINIRRRSLLSVWLKIYMVGGILLGLLSMLIVVIAWMEAQQQSSWISIGLFSMMMTLVILYIVKYVLLWLEVRSAIRWNWIVGGIYTLVITIGMFVSGSIPFIALELISIPYWVMLARIQHKWELTAVSGRSMHR